jgi:hypothetical protein
MTIAIDRDVIRKKAAKESRGVERGDTPNAETIAAIEEGRAILAGTIPDKSLSVDDFFKEMGY